MTCLMPRCKSVKHVTLPIPSEWEENTILLEYCPLRFCVVEVGYDRKQFEPS